MLGYEAFSSIHHEGSDLRLAFAYEKISHGHTQTNNITVKGYPQIPNIYADFFIFRLN